LISEIYKQTDTSSSNAWYTILKQLSHIFQCTETVFIHLCKCSISEVYVSKATDHKNIIAS